MRTIVGVYLCLCNLFLRLQCRLGVLRRDQLFGEEQGRDSRRHQEHGPQVQRAVCGLSHGGEGRQRRVKKCVPLSLHSLS